MLSWQNIIRIVVAILFLLFAILQFNDPDSLVWIAAYLFAFLVTIPPILGRHTFLPAVGLIGYGFWFVTLAGSIGPDWLQVEEAREALGLLLAMLWMGVLLYGWVQLRRERK